MTANDGEVYGAIYAILLCDEADLDRNECVNSIPSVYVKEMLTVDYWSICLYQASEGISRPLERCGIMGQPVQALIYVDRRSTEEGKATPPVIFRMQHAIEELLSFGVPEEWLTAVILKYIPEADHTDTEEEAWEKERQVIRCGIVETPGTVAWEHRFYDLAWPTRPWDCLGLKLPPPPKRTAGLVLTESLYPFTVGLNW